ncbi:hypothetical protein Bca4012_005627 [Brassica carinata]
MKPTSQTHLGCNLLPTKRLGTSHIYVSHLVNLTVAMSRQEPQMLLHSHLCAKRQKMLEDMEKDFEGGQEADKLDGGGSSKSGGSLASRTLGLEWKRYKLMCVIGRRRRWSTRCDGVSRGVVRRYKTEL